MRVAARGELDLAPLAERERPSLCPRFTARSRIFPFGVLARFTEIGLPLSCPRLALKRGGETESESEDEKELRLVLVIPRDLVCP